MAEKPIHLKCPKCGYDFAYNANHIEQQIEEVKEELLNIKAKIQQLNRDYPNKAQLKKNKEYRNLIAAQDRRIARLQHLKKARNGIHDKIENEKNEIFKQLVKSRLGLEEYMQLLQEAEDTMRYNTAYEMAIQDHNTFNGA